MIILESFLDNNIEMMIDEACNYLIEADNTTNQEPKVGNNDMKNNEKQQANQEQQQKKQENPKKESTLKDKWNNFFEAVKRIFTKIINRIKSIFGKITNSELKNIPDKTMITDWDYKNDIIGKLDELINSTNNIRSKLNNVVGAIKNKDDLEEVAQAVNEYTGYCQKYTELNINDYYNKSEKVELDASKKKDLYMNFQNRISKLQNMDRSLTSLENTILNTQSFIRNGGRQGDDDTTRDKRLRYSQTAFTTTMKVTSNMFKFIASASNSLNTVKNAVNKPKENGNREENNNKK